MSDTQEKLEALYELITGLQEELDDLKEIVDDLNDSESAEESKERLQAILEKSEKIEANLGVEKVVFTDLGEKVQVVVQTPLGCVVFALPHTANTAGHLAVQEKPTPDQSTPETAAPVAQNAPKGAAPAGMTPEQLQDFKKQTLQINMLQQRIKELETKLAEANSLIKTGEDVTKDLQEKEFLDVKEIYLYLDNINNTMSEKIAQQRDEMKKLAGDEPQPINYDPFNYGEAYAGDIVDFEARKRILEIQMLLQGMVTSMAQMRESVTVSPEISLGYKVMRLDQLVEATGFGQAQRAGELTHEDGLLVEQSEQIEPPERRYPRKEAFQTDEDKESKWAMTDSIMQTMYRLEMELGDLQKLVGTLDVASSVKDMEELVSTIKKQGRSTQFDEDSLRPLIEKYCRNMMLAQQMANQHQKNRSLDSQGIDHFSMQLNNTGQQKAFQDLQTMVKMLKNKLTSIEKAQGGKPDSSGRKWQKTPNSCMCCDTNLERPIYKYSKAGIPKLPFFSPYLNPRLTTYYKQPVRLRSMLQRDFFVPNIDPCNDVYHMPRPHGKGYYNKTWPQPDPANKSIDSNELTSLVTPTSGELALKGTDGRVYKGDNSTSTPKGPAAEKGQRPMKLENLRWSIQKTR